MKWEHYPELESLRRLRNEGRELLGKDVYITEKRDGSNISVWLDELKPKISSHNLETASEDLQKLMLSVPEYTKIFDFLMEEKLSYGHEYIVYGELVSGRGATRIERLKKNSHWILFDIRNCEDERFLGYNNIHQHAYHWKIPIVKALSIINVNTMEELNSEIQKWLQWCRRHAREGIVGKNYSEQIMFKEKVDLPKLERVKSESNKPQYPPMPEDRIFRALQHTWDIVGEENWMRKEITMPELAKQIVVEGKEHNFSSPHNFYKIYLEAPIDKIKEKKE